MLLPPYFQRAVILTNAGLGPLIIPHPACMGRWQAHHRHWASSSWCIAEGAACCSRCTQAVWTEAMVGGRVHCVGVCASVLATRVQASRPRRRAGTGRPGREMGSWPPCAEGPGGGAYRFIVKASRLSAPKMGSRCDHGCLHYIMRRLNIVINSREQSGGQHLVNLHCIWHTGRQTSEDSIKTPERFCNSC